MECETAGPWWEIDCHHSNHACVVPNLVIVYGVQRASRKNDKNRCKGKKPIIIRRIIYM